MHSRKPEVSVRLAGEPGFIYRNLQLQLQAASGLTLFEEDLDVSGLTAEYAVYVYSDRDTRHADKSCKKNRAGKIAEIKRIGEEGTPVIVLGAETADLPEWDELAEITPIPLPDVFGKWANPDSGSPVALACTLVQQRRESRIDVSANLELLYIDDLANNLLDYLLSRGAGGFEPGPLHRLAMADLRTQLVSFRDSRESLIMPAVGSGLPHALYATYISYLDADSFSYPLENHADKRGSFIEIIKTETHGQISCLTADPGITRGQHYHHSKSEKFLVVQGKARFCFRNLLTRETHEIIVSADKPEIVETIPGWVHNITNVSDEQMIVILWANELFNPEYPDTIPGEI